jgi:hypothetical protein
VLAHLFFGGQTLAEFIEYKIGADRCDAAYQDNQHPFYDIAPSFSLPTANEGRCSKVPRRA